MSKELECLDRIDKRNYLTEREHKEFLGVVEKAIKEYEAIENANPSEALECLEKIIDNLDDYADFEIKQEANEYIDTIKQALLKAQEPKQYLKWEDLEFYSEWKCKAVKLNGTKYKIKYKCDFDFFNNYYQEIVIYSDDDRTVFAKLRDKKQFFNDLHLERVEE